MSWKNVKSGFLSVARAAVFAGVLSMVFAAQAIPVDEPYLADSRELIDVPASLPGICTMGGVARTDGQGLENVALRPGVTPRASSSLHVAPHRIENLNDGANGNPHSWILGEKTGWVQLEFGRAVYICRIGFASDVQGRYIDRAITAFDLQVPDGEGWRTIYSYAGEPVIGYRRFSFPPVRTVILRLVIRDSIRSQPRIDELEVFGSDAPITAEQAAPAPDPNASTTNRLERAALGEELAWLKQEGWADIERTQRHGHGYPEAIVPERQEIDILPLPDLPSAPVLDGRGTDTVWRACSRGVARVGRITDWASSPLVEQSVEAGVSGGRLYAAIEGKRFFSANLSVVGVPGTAVRGLLAHGESGLVFTRLDVKNARPEPVKGVFNAERGRVEFALPLSALPGAAQKGAYVTAGIGGRWTPNGGRPVCFRPAGWSVRQEGVTPDGGFRVSLTVGRPHVQVAMTSPQMRTRRRFFQPALMRKTYTLDLRPDDACGTLGPRMDLEFREQSDGSPFRLTLFRYDPAVRMLALYREMLERRGMDLAPYRAFAAEHATLVRKGDFAAERAFLWRLRTAKRTLFLSDPGLAPAQSLLVSKRHPFHPSHNYSVQFDSAWRPGGGVCRIDIPRSGEALDPDAAKTTLLASAGTGMIRTPALSFDATRLYYAERTSSTNYFRIWEQDLATGKRRQLSDNGPFHDYWPTPLPDGGIAFISTRCKVRFLCWRPQAAVLFRMERDGSGVRPLSFANLSEFAPSVMDDGRILWTRSEYVDKGADYGHTVWTIRADGTYPELTYGNTIALPQGYANARMMPGSQDLCATMISHFGDLNGPLALIDLRKGPHDPSAIRNLTPEVPRPGARSLSDTFREAFPLSADLLLAAWAPQDRFGIWALDRYGNRELLYEDDSIDTICPTLFAPRPVPRAMRGTIREDLKAAGQGLFVVENVYRGLEGQVKPGAAKWLRICQEMPAVLDKMPDGTYRADHTPYMRWYASPTDVQRGAFGWASFIAKGVVGTVPVEDDGSAHFLAPSGKVLYFQLLDGDYNEIQRMRSVVQLQPGEVRSCIGCHESRLIPPDFTYLKMKAMKRAPTVPAPPPWGAGPFRYEQVVQPVLDRRCIVCHSAAKKHRLVLEGTRDKERVPVSWRTLLNSGTVHYFTYEYQRGVPYKAEPYTFGTFASRLWDVLKDERHKGVKLDPEEEQAIKCWIDMNCPLWGDYTFRPDRPE